MSLSAGSQLGAYEILGPIGAGGMGEVYKARDTRLRRIVAIKISAERFSGRFKREARAISALNDPHICSLYDIGEQDGLEYLVMEHVEGETLACILKGPRIPVDQALRYAIQIASALRAAHARGIIHRDLKPANIIISEAGVKVLDFGLAKLLSDPAATEDMAEKSTEIMQTRAGQILGTVAYMSPEQAEGRAVDAGSDLFSMGVMLYEMLCGHRPFRGDTPISTLAAILRETPAPPRRIRREIPPELDRIVLRCLEKQPKQRYCSAEELLQELEGCCTIPPARRRRWLTIAAALAAIVIIAGVGIRWYIHGRRTAWAKREALPGVVRLMSRSRPLAALQLLRTAESYLPESSELIWIKDQLVPAAPYSIETTPAGADIYVREYADGDNLDLSRWEFLGRSPLRTNRLAIGYYRLEAIKKGFEPVERALAVFPSGGTLQIRMHTPAETPAGMVWVSQPSRALAGLIIGALPTVDLPDFWMDKYEVTNRQFKEFLDSGGYQKQKYWKQPFVRSDQALSWEQGMAEFRDATGKPGPATWQLGAYPEGKADFPVGGVSWYEAAAYAEFVGKSLPTVYHWWYAAGQWSIYSEILQLSNFSTESASRVGIHRGLAPFGSYDMAGNIKEWCWNPAADRRYILGGAWNEPSYQFMLLDARRPFDRAETFGFRCAKYLTPPSQALSGPVPTGVSRDRRSDKPADDRAFRIYRSLHSYDKADLKSVVESVDESSPYWRKQKITFQAGYGNERVVAHLYLPRNAAPPFQPVAFYGGADIFTEPTVGLIDAEGFSHLVRAGRAVIVPAYKGTLERGPGAYYHLFGQPNRWRDMNLQQSKDLGRTIDYLETRPDIDVRKLAFVGRSLGAALAPHLIAVEPRIQVAVLLSGGSFEKVPAEVDSWNFAPRVKIPVLMVNGRDDFRFPLESSQLPLFRLLGTLEKDKRHVLCDGGHVAIYSHPELVKEILDWLDRYLGSVRTAGSGPL